MPSPQVIEEAESHNRNHIKGHLCCVTLATVLNLSVPLGWRWMRTLGNNYCWEWFGERNEVEHPVQGLVGCRGRGHIYPLKSQGLLGQILTQFNALCDRHLATKHWILIKFPCSQKAGKWPGLFWGIKDTLWQPRATFLKHSTSTESNRSWIVLRSLETPYPFAFSSCIIQGASWMALKIFNINQEGSF